MYIVLLMLIYCFPGTCGFQICEKIIPVKSQHDITLRYENSIEENLCHLPNVLRCPERTLCKGNIELCTVSNSSMKIFCSPAEFGKYFFESGKGDWLMTLESGDCKDRVANNTEELKPGVTNGYKERVVNNTEEIKPEVTIEWTTYILVLFCVVAVVVLVAAAVVLIRKCRWCRSSEKRSSIRWCRSSEKRSSIRASNSTTPETVSFIGDNSSTNTGVEP